MELVPDNIVLKANWLFNAFHSVREYFTHIGTAQRACKS